MVERWTSLRLAKKVTVSRGVLGWPVVGPDAIYVEDWRDEIVRLDRKTLRVVWRRPADKSRAAYLCGSVLVTGSMSGRIGARLAESGEWLWQKETRFGTHLWNGRLIVPGDGFEILEPETGEVTDSFPVAGGVSGPGRLCGDVLVCEHGEQGDPVKAVNLQERRLLWECNLLADMQSQYGVDESVPVIGLVAGSMPDRFIAARGGSVFGCSLEDGRILWRASVPVSYHWPNVHEGRIYVHRCERFWAIDEATGEIVYDVTHPELREAYLGKPGTVYQDKVAMPNESGHLAVFGLKDGSLVWRYQYKGQLWRTAEADGRLLAGTGDGKLLVFADFS